MNEHAVEGLSSIEVTRRRAEFGANAVVEEKIHPIRRVLRHFWSPSCN